MVYKMTCRIKDDSHWDLWKSQGYKPCWSVRWGVYTNSPKRHGSVGIAGQTRVFKDQESAEKYLRGRIKAYAHLFTEISPQIPKEYDELFRVNNQLLPGYRSETEPAPAAYQEKASVLEKLSTVRSHEKTAASKIADTAITVLKAAGHTADGSMNYDDFMNVVHSLGLQGKLPSGVNRAAVAYAIFKYGTLYNTRGATVAKDLDEVDALLYYLGFDRREQTIPYLYNYMRADMNQKKADMLKSLKPLALLYYKKGDFTNMRNVVSLMTQDLSGVDRSSIYESLCDYIGKSTRTEPEKILQGLMRSRYIDLANKQTLETAIKVQGGN